MGQIFPQRYLMHEARKLINFILSDMAPFLETSDMAWCEMEWKAQSSSEMTKFKSSSFLFSLGKGSSSISSDVSSSTDHTPTQAQKNVATSEGRRLVFIISCALVTGLAVFGRYIKCVSLRSVLLSGSIWDSQKWEAKAFSFIALLSMSTKVVLVQFKVNAVILSKYNKLTFGNVYEWCLVFHYGKHDCKIFLL